MRKIEDFISGNFRSERTRHKHKSNLLYFFDFLKVDPEKYIDSKRNFDDDLKKFWENIKEKPEEIQDEIMTSVMLYLSVYGALEVSYDKIKEFDKVEPITALKYKCGTGPAILAGA